MPDFSKYSNYNEDSSFHSVRFGANAPVLEVEQNELQQIYETKLKRLTTIMGDTFFVESNGSTSIYLNDDTVEPTDPQARGYIKLSNCTIISKDGFTVHIGNEECTFKLDLWTKEAELPSRGDRCLIYAKLSKVSKNYADDIPKYGLVSDDPIVPYPVGTITNKIVDDRVGVETSVRYAIQCTIESTTGALPENDGNNQYVLLYSCVLESSPADNPIVVSFISERRSVYTYDEMYSDVYYKNLEKISLMSYGLIPCYIDDSDGYTLTVNLIPQKKGLLSVSYSVNQTNTPTITIPKGDGSFISINPSDITAISARYQFGHITLDISFNSSETIKEGYYIMGMHSGDYLIGVIAR